MKEQISELVREAILSLPQDLKAMLRVIEDPELDESERVRCVGAVLYVLSAVNSIPGARGVLAYVDDVLVMRLVMAGALEKSRPVVERYQEDAPEFLGGLEDFVTTLRSYLGEGIAVLEKAVQQVDKLSHQGHSAAQCAADVETDTWFFDSVHAAIVEQLEFDEDEVAREIKRLDALLRPLRSAAARG